MVWERSVRATHDFLADADIVALRPLVEVALSDDALELWVLTEPEDAPVGFMGLAGDDIWRSSWTRRVAGRVVVADW